MEPLLKSLNPPKRFMATPMIARQPHYKVLPTLLIKAADKNKNPYTNRTERVKQKELYTPTAQNLLLECSKKFRCCRPNAFSFCVSTKTLTMLYLCPGHPVRVKQNREKPENSNCQET